MRRCITQSIICFAALYGTVFSDESEAAFSNYRMWESLGFIIAFAYSNYLCTSVKLYILMSVLIIGMSGYAYVEVTLKRKSASRDITTDVIRRVEPRAVASKEDQFAMKTNSNKDGHKSAGNANAVDEM